jgi:hypothetical protein
MCGITTCSVNAVATAASNELPPSSSMRMPTCAAIQCVAETTPKLPTISGRVVNGACVFTVVSLCIARVEHVAQAVAEQVAAKHRETDEGAWPDRHPWRIGNEAARRIQ